MNKSRVLIIEDEPPAANRLKKLLTKIDAEIDFIDTIDTVSSAIKFLNNFKQIDLIFMDIQLSDGLSFEIFNEVKIEVPIIFTTAFDNYTLNAFKVNSVDYLLKPIEPDELHAAYEKYQKFHVNEITNNDHLQSIFGKYFDQNYKKRFIIKSGSEIKYIDKDDIAYFFSEDGYTHICSKKGLKFIVDYKMDEIENLVDPKQFFRINRKFIINLESITKIESYFNSRFKLKLQPIPVHDVIVSRERSSSFKIWLDQ